VTSGDERPSSLGPVRARVPARRAAALLATVGAGLVLAACAASPARVMQREVFVRRGPCPSAARAYDLYVGLPEGYDDPARAAERWPLLLYLPGMLSFGRDVARPLRGGPPNELEQGRRLPMVVVMPTTPTFLERWTPPLVLRLIDDACARYRIDPDRVYLSGVSIGAWGAWDAAQAHPERIAAVLTVAGWGEPWGVDRMVDVPAWAFHGSLDLAVPPAFHRRMTDALAAAGGRARFTCVPGGAHWIWDRVYARDDVYAWLLAQRKVRRPGP
jgi:predicted peptidase